MNVRYFRTSRLCESTSVLSKAAPNSVPRRARAEGQAPTKGCPEYADSNPAAATVCLRTAPPFGTRRSSDRPQSVADLQAAEASGRSWPISGLPGLLRKLTMVGRFRVSKVSLLARIRTHALGQLQS